MSATAVHSAPPPPAQSEDELVSQRRLLSLEDSAQATLDSGFRWLRFPKRLERQFEQDSATERVSRFRIYGAAGVLLIDIFGYGDFRMIPDVARFALLLRLCFLTPVIALVTYFLPQPWFARHREWLAAGQVILTTLTLNALLLTSCHPNALHYHTGILVIYVFGVMLIRLRFWFAAVWMSASRRSGTGQPGQVPHWPSSSWTSTTSRPTTTTTGIRPGTHA